MASVINTNIASLYAQKNLSGAQSALSTAVERLSSGLRINRAKDDAAGLGISENIKQQITSVNQGIRNANDAISMVQTAEGSLSEVSSILQRMKELSVQARNDSLSTVQRTYISDELVALKNEINSIAERTTFNDISLAKNGLRTAVSQAVTGSNQLQNGASVLSGLTVSGLSVGRTNAGTYTLKSSTETLVSGQISAADYASAETSQVKSITIGGVWNVGDKITATVEIQGGARVAAEYYVTAADIAAGDQNQATGSVYINDPNDQGTYTSIASNLAKAIESQVMATTGATLGVTASGTSVYVNNPNKDNSLAVTTVVDSRIQRTGTSVATATVGTTTINANPRTITISEEDAVEGNRFVLSVNGREYSVTASSTADAATIPPAASKIRNQVASDLARLLAADYPASGVVSHLDADGAANSDDDTGIIAITSAAGLGVADISLKVLSRQDGDTVKNIASVVSAPSTTTQAQSRAITFDSFDVAAGREASVTISGPSGQNTFSLVMRNSDTNVSVATRMGTLINQVYGNVVTADYASGKVTIGAAANLGQFNISLSMNDAVDGSAVDSQSSVTDPAYVTSERNIKLNQADLSVGRIVSVNVDGKEYATKVESSDTVNDVATRLVSLMDDDFSRTVGTVTTPTVDTNVTAAVRGAFTQAFQALTAGQSTTVAGLTYTSLGASSSAEVAAAFANLANGATRGDSSLGTYSGTFAGYSSGAVSSSSVVFTQDAAATLATTGFDALTSTTGTALAVSTGTAGVAPTARETADLTFSAMSAGDSLKINGLTFTAGRAITAAESAAAFANMSSTSNTTGAGIAYGTYEGAWNYSTTDGWTTGSATGATITATTAVTAATTDPANIDRTITATRVDAGAYVADRGQAEWNLTFKAMAAGETLTLTDTDTTVVTFTARRALTAEEAASAFTGLTDGFDVATVANSINGSFAVTTAGTNKLEGWKSSVVSGATVKFTSTGTGTTAPTFGGTAGAIPSAVSVNDEATIVLGASSKLGHAEISVSVKDITNAGKFTLTANDDTGIGGVSQTIDMGTIAAGGSKLMMFDKLGVNFTLNNSRDVAVGAEDFQVYSTEVDTLTVDATGAGSAQFQVGAATRDVVSVDGFKDIRITGYNKNSGEEASVFDRLYATLNTIAANTTESLSSENFATLENQIEDVITTVADFRSYFGAQQNRIEFAISNLQAQAENLTAANSRIRDTDYAAETANLTKTQIMQQAATAMLAQANQMPNVILALLK